MLANNNCCVSSCTRGEEGPHGQLSTVRIRVPNRGSIRPNTNSPFGPLFGPVEIRIEYSVQPYKLAPYGTDG